MAEEKEARIPNVFNPLLAVVVLVLALVCWLNFGPFLSMGILYLQETELTDVWLGITDYLIVNAPYLLFFLALLFGSNFILKTKLRELLSGNGHKYRYKYSLLVGLVYVFMGLIFTLFSVKHISVDKTPLLEKLKVLPFILIFTPMAALSEEIFFRALPARFAYGDTLPKTIKKSIPLVIISGAIFLMPHLLNVEVQDNPIPFTSCLYYFLRGASAMALSLYTDGFEAPVAMHTANNLYIALLVNKESSSMPTHALFVDSSPYYSNWFSLIELIVFFLAVFTLSYFLKKHKSKLIAGTVNVQKKEETN